MIRLSNFDTDYIDSVMPMEGVYDSYDISAADLQGASGQIVIKQRNMNYIEVNNNHIYDVLYTPLQGFLNNNVPLLQNTELKLTFDRSRAETALLNVPSGDNSGFAGKAIEIKECYAVAEYISSPSLRAYFNQIDRSPLNYKYDEVDVTIRAIPQHESFVRLDNIRGGNLPDFIFFGIIEADAFNGTFEKSSTGFYQCNVEEVNLTVNGNACHGYPIQIQNVFPLWPYHKWLQVTSRYMNVSA